MEDLNIATPPRSPIQGSPRTQGDLKWSQSERKTARRAFENALKQEPQEVIRKAKEMSAKVPSELWDLEDLSDSAAERDPSQVRVPGIKAHVPVGDATS